MPMTSWLLSLVLLAPQGSSSSLFQSENAGTGQFSFRDGVLEIASGGGWLRTPRIYSDFRLSLDFRLEDTRAAAHVVVRALVSEGRVLPPAYEVRIPHVLSATPVTAVAAPKSGLRVIREGHIEARPASEWQRLELTARRESLTLRLNDQVVGEYEIERLAGYLLITPSSGRVYMRNIEVSAFDPTFNPPVGTMTMAQLKEAKGRSPKIRREVKPFYTIETLHQRKVHGSVVLEAVVLPSGAVGDVRVLRSLDPDLDQSAIASLRKWTFTPASVNDQPVPVLVEVEMTFSIGPPVR